MPPTQRPYRPFVLHLVTLAFLAVGEPLLDLLKKFPEFLAVRELGSREIVLLLVALIVVPAVPALLIWTTSARSRLQGGTSVLLLMLFSTLLVSRWVVLHTNWGGPFAIGLAVALAGLFTFGYLRSLGVRTFVTYLGWSLLVMPALFWFHPSTAKMRHGATDRNDSAVTVTRPAPVVWLIFDELAFSSLADENGTVDREWFPNFAALADRSHWFSNASTVSVSTTRAVPSALTGRFPRLPELPILADHPNNLFTYLADSHSVFSEEPVTSLCPVEINVLAAPSQGSLKTFFSDLLADLGVVYLHLVVPPPYAGSLPSISEGWGQFGAAERTAQQQPSSGSSSLAAMESSGSTATASERSAEGASGSAGASASAESEDAKRRRTHEPFQQRAAAANRGDRSGSFLQFIETIDGSRDAPLYFAHVLLPHVPWVYSPSGKQYTEPLRKAIGLEGKVWASDNPWSLEEAYQRHFLQLRFLDQLVGRLTDRLHSEGLFDDALIVLTSDHGLSFRSGDNRRSYTETNAADILAIPLLIKEPGQTAAVVHSEPVSTIDILPTVLERLGAELPAPIEGRSLLPATAGDGEPRKALIYKTMIDILPSLHRDKYTTIAHRRALFGSRRAEFTDFDLLQSGLVGTAIGSIDIGAAAEGVVRLHGPRTPLQYDPDADLFPGRLLCELEAGEGELSERLVVALNGRIAATRSVPNSTESEPRQFSVLLPEEFFVPGENEVEFYLLTDAPPVRRSLQRIRSEPVATRRPGSGRTARSPRGESR